MNFTFPLKSRNTFPPNCKQLILQLPDSFRFPLKQQLINQESTFLRNELAKRVLIQMIPVAAHTWWGRSFQTSLTSITLILTSLVWYMICVAVINV